VQELPLPKFAGNYIAFNKSVAERVIKRFNKEYKKLKMKDDYKAYNLPNSC